MFKVLFPELKFITVPLTELYSMILSKTDYGHPFFWLKQKSHQVLEQRVEGKIHQNDYLQLLIDSQSDEFKKENVHENMNYNEMKIEKKLTFDVII